MPRKREQLARLEKLARGIGKMPAAARADLLRLSGWNEAKLVALTGKLMGLIEDELTATTTQRLVLTNAAGREREDRVVEYHDPDHRARLGAMSLMISVLGLQAPKNAGGVDTGDMVINVILPPRAAPQSVEVIDVTPPNTAI